MDAVHATNCDRKEHKWCISRFNGRKRTVMAFGLTFRITLCVHVLIIAACVALILETDTRFENRKCVGSSHKTLQHYSKIKCVQKCHEENTKGLCNVAGYDKATKTCYLSMDSYQDVLDVNDESFGVYFIEKGRLHFNCNFALSQIKSIGAM